MTAQGPPGSGRPALVPGWVSHSGAPPAAPTAVARLQEDALIGMIEQQGIRLAWQRSAICPGADAAGGLTGHPSGNCARCGGKGRFWYGPKAAVIGADPVLGGGTLVDPALALAGPDANSVGALTALQKEVLHNGALIRGIVQRETWSEDFYGEFGRWRHGGAAVSVRPENRMGYYDRLIQLDDEAIWSETVTEEQVTAPAVKGAIAIRLKFPIIAVEALHTLTARFEPEVDYTVSAKGLLLLKPGRIAREERFTVNYSTFPTWLVSSALHAPRGVQTMRAAAVFGSTNAQNTAPGTRLTLQYTLASEFLAPADEALPVKL